MRKIILLSGMLCLVVISHAQKENSDTILPKGNNYRYIGIQANLLLQQFISFNSNSSINTNPYIFTFSKSNCTSGNSFALGTGFNVSENSSNDGVSSITVQNANITFRFGFEKKYLQRQRLIPFWGVDLGFGGVYNKTTSRLNQSFNNNATVTETAKYFFGPSYRGGLLCALSKHILLGTEFFFNMQIAYSTNNGVIGAQDAIPFNIGFQAPTALFLVFRY